MPAGTARGTAGSSWGDSGSGPLSYWLTKEAPYIIRLQYEQPATSARWLLTMT
jgi:hypothetical protein